jgi:thioredoxin reductase (NADPH)
MVNAGVARVKLKVNGGGRGGSRRSSELFPADVRATPCSPSALRAPVCARHVHVVIRGAGLAETMSRYLIRRLEENPNVTLWPHSEIVGLEGDDRLRAVRWKKRDGSVVTREIRHVFLMIGAEPNSGWLEGCVALDDKGFVKTGLEVTRDELTHANWPLARPPFLFETSRHRVFAVGDVRSGSVKRVASAVGEGSICVQLVHRALAE